jgi:hypothetical protein
MDNQIQRAKLIRQATLVCKWKEPVPQSVEFARRFALEMDSSGQRVAGNLCVRKLPVAISYFSYLSFDWLGTETAEAEPIARSRGVMAGL